jgi:hypothetical protein
MSDVEDRLREELDRLAPHDLSARDLTTGAWAYYARVRRRKVAAAASALAVVMVLIGVAVSIPGRTSSTLPAGPVTTPGDCSAASAVTPAVADTPPAPVTVVATWICPDPAAGTGNRLDLPLVPLSGPYAAQLSVEPWTANSCESPASTAAAPYTLYRMEGTERRVTAYHSKDASCRADSVLAAYLTAQADQQADRAAAQLALAQLPCRSDTVWSNEKLAATDATAGPQPIDASGRTPLAAATLCLRPLYLQTDGESVALTQPLTFRKYVAIPLDNTLLAALDADLQQAREGFHGKGQCLAQGRWTYTIIAKTQTGKFLKMNTSCLDELFIVTHTKASDANRYGFIPSAETTAALEGLVAGH